MGYISQKTTVVQTHVNVSSRKVIKKVVSGLEKTFRPDRSKIKKGLRNVVHCPHKEQNVRVGVGEG